MITVLLTVAAALLAPLLGLADRRQHGRHVSGTHKWPWTVA